MIYVLRCVYPDFNMYTFIPINYINEKFYLNYQMYHLASLPDDTFGNLGDYEWAFVHIWSVVAIIPY